MILTKEQDSVVRTEFMKTMWGNIELENNYTLTPHKLSVLNSAIRAYPFQRGRIALPNDTDFFYVYTLNKFQTGGLKSKMFKVGVWLSITDFCNDNDLLLRIRFKESQLYTDYSKTFITLLPNHTIVLATLDIGIKNPDVLIDLRKSRLDSDNTVTVYTKVIKTQTDVNEAIQKYTNWSNKGGIEVILNGCPKITITASDLVKDSVLTIIDDSSLEREIVLPINELDTYNMGDAGNYFILEVPELEKTELLHAHDMRCYLENVGLNQSVFIDRLIDGKLINQLTNKHVGLKVNTLYNALTELQWSIHDIRIRLLLPKPVNNYVGNIQYLKNFNEMTSEQQLDVLTGVGVTPSLWYAENLHDCKFNQTLLYRYIDLDKEKNFYPTYEIDRLFNTGYRSKDLIGEDFSNVSKVFTPTLSYKDGVFLEFNPDIVLGDKADIYKLGYKKELSYASDSFNTTEINLPVVFNKAGELGVKDTDYTVAQGLLILKNDAVAVDLQSSSFFRNVPVELNFNVNIPELTTYLKIGDVDVYDQNMVFMHPGIDYTTTGNRLIIWRVNVTHVNYNVLPTLNSAIVETGWTLNSRISINGDYRADDLDSLVIFVGDKLQLPNEIEWEEEFKVSKPNTVPNGVPYTIVKLTLNDLAFNNDLTKVVEDRMTHKENLTSISQYMQGNIYIPDEPTLIDNYYPIKSPFLTEVLRGVVNGTIPTDNTSLNELGLSGCIGASIINNYDLGYDPSTSDDINTKVTALVGHENETPIVLTNDEYRFLELVNRGYLNNRVKMNEYFRVSI